MPVSPAGDVVMLACLAVPSYTYSVPTVSVAGALAMIRVPLAGAAWYKSFSSVAATEYDPALVGGVAEPS